MSFLRRKKRASFSAIGTSGLKSYPRGFVHQPGFVRVEVGFLKTDQGKCIPIVYPLDPNDHDLLERWLNEITAPRECSDA